MKLTMKRRIFIFGAGASLVSVPLWAAEQPAPLVIAVMDPLALELACSCIPGFAQRKYRVLAEHLQKELGRPVVCVFSESLRATFTRSPTGKIDLLIGKDDIVKHDAKEFRLEIEPLAKLTDLEGKTTHHGIFVVEKNDPARMLEDLASHKIIFGPEHSTERRVEPVRMLRSSGVTIPGKPYSSTSEKDAVMEIFENEDAAVRVCALVAAQSLKLMEGCQLIERGSLRILERTPEVPFIAAFTAKAPGPETVTEIRKSLLAFGKDEKNCIALESKKGFIAYEKEKEKETGHRA